MNNEVNNQNYQNNVENIPPLVPPTPIIPTPEPTFTPTTPITNVGESNSTKKESSIRKAPVIISVIILAILVGLYFFVNSPKNIMLCSVNNTYKEVSSFINKIRGGKVAKLAKNNVVKTTSTISFNTSLYNNDASVEYKDIKTLLDKLEINVINTEDQKNKERLTKVDIYQNHDVLLSLISYAKDTNQYIYLKDIFEKYIKISDSEYISFYDTKSTKDYSYLSTKIKNLFFKQLKDSDFSQKNTKLILDNKKIDTSKITLTINNKRSNEITKSILEGLKKDKKSITAIKNIYNTTNQKSGGKVNDSDITKMIDDMIKDINKDQITKVDSSIYLSVYTRGLLNEPVKYEISQKNETGVLSYTKYQNVGKKTVRELAYSNGDFITSIILISNDNNIQYTINMSKSKLIDGMISNRIEEIKANKQFKNNQQIVINVYNKNNKYITLTINTDTVTDIGIPLDRPDISNNVDINNLSDNNNAQISAGFIEAFTKLLLELIPQEATF